MAPTTKQATTDRLESPSQGLENVPDDDDDEENAYLNKLKLE